ncbi:membrane hypothetical protein [Candidatus Sulfopaludibacter sp. SbA6]|nr:membrane hypothetical protein [Candidatus Sulfopaludibacter sp. SbA6]
MWIWNFAEQLAQDIRYALRMIATNRLFTAMAVLSLALGIGANTAIYSFMDAILLRALPVERPEELVVLNWRAKGNPPVIHGQNGSRFGDRKTGIVTSPNYPFAAYEALRAKPDQLATLFAYANAWQVNLIARGQAEVASGLFVSGGFYSGLGVAPAAGRLILDEDDRAGAAPVAVIGYRYWQRRFAANPDAVGQAIVINNVPFTIVGVSAPGFFGVDAGNDPPVFMPLHAVPLLAQHPADEERRRFFDKNFYWVEMMGRLRPGVAIGQAEAALATGIVFGLAPAIQATRVDLTPALKETRASAPRGRFPHQGLRLGGNQLLVVAQIAISLLLVIAAGLFVHTVSNLHSVELGFNREKVLIFSLNARQAGYKDAALARIYAGLRDRFRAIPGVRSAGISNFPLVSHYVDTEYVLIPGAPAPAGRPPQTSLLDVDPFLLSTMQIPILLGRGIEERDMVSGRVAVVNEKFATTFFGKENPIGRTIGIGAPKTPPDIEIVGIARNAHYNSLQEDIPPVAYLPYTRNLGGLGGVFFELRTAGDPLALVGAVRQIVAETDSRVPLAGINTEARQIDQTISQERTFANLCTCFAVLALLIACVGLYGAMAYAVARRTGEIGIRMALGAERRNIVWIVLREVLTLTAAGLVIGLAAAWASTHFIASFLFGTKPNDPLAISLSIAILAAAGLAAGYAPAWRASRIDPMTALRHE